MATWTGVITNGGSALLTEWVNGKVLRFDRAAAGEGTVDVVALLAQTALVSEKQVISILGSEKVGTGIRLKMRIQAAPTAYTMHQIGIWASCGDGESVMIALFQHQTGIPIPSQAESPDFAYTFYALVSCSNTGEWELNVDPSAFVNHGDLNEAINSLTAQSVGAIAEEEKGKANGVATLDDSGKVPESQLPPMDYDPEGTAENEVAAHNDDETAHPHLLEQIEACETAVQKAQNTADDALEAVDRIEGTINSAPSQSGTITYNGASQSPAWNGYDTNAMTIGGTTSGTNAGTYNATFTPKAGYQWWDGSTSAKTVSWTIGKAPMTIPSQSGTITYNGASQSPAWNGYDTNAMTIGGTTSGTNAGTYNATFTPKSNFKWLDGGNSAKTVSWTIGKAPGSLFLSESSISLDITKMSETIKVMRAGSGEISASSNSPGISVSVSGDKVTVTSTDTSNATITVSVASDGNYTSVSKDCSVSSTLPSRILSENDWATIHQASRAGQGANFWAVGDMKSVTINGQVGNTIFTDLSINVFIIGFNHNSAKEGNNLIHFQIGKMDSMPIGLCDSNYNSDMRDFGYFTFNTSGTNEGGWKSCYKRSTLYGNSGVPTSPASNSLIGALPSDLRAVMQPVVKYTDNVGYGSGSVRDNVTATTDYLFDLSEFEVFGSRSRSNEYEQNSQAQYDYYKAGNSKAACSHYSMYSMVIWGLRSPVYDYFTNFCAVEADGTSGQYYAHKSLALRPGFAA